LTSAAHRRKVIELIGEANVAGAGLVSACSEIGICLRTLKRWRKAFLGDGDGMDRRKGSPRLVAHRLSEEERQRILLTCNQPEYASLPAAADSLAPAVLRYHIAGIGHMGAESEGVGPKVIGAHHSPCRIHSHHHRLALLHPGQLGLGLADGWIVREGFAGAEHRLQQRPHRRPVGRRIGADLKWCGQRGQDFGSAEATFSRSRTGTAAAHPNGDDPLAVVSKS
jgi:transposase-like protein